MGFSRSMALFAIALAELVAKLWLGRVLAVVALGPVLPSGSAKLDDRGIHLVATPARLLV